MAAAPSTKCIAAAMEKVLDCSDKISGVLHDYTIGRGGRATSGLEGQISVFDATISVLRQVYDLVKSELNGKKVFSDEGLEYINTLTKEFASELIKIHPIFEDACLTRKDLDAKKKAEKKAAGKKKIVIAPASVQPKPNVDDCMLNVDKVKLLELVEHANWSMARNPLSKCLQRLFDVQTHFLLVAQVVTLGTLSRDLPSGKADLKSIVAYHERIERTADLLYLRLASKYPDSDCDTVDSIFIGCSSSDSDARSIDSDCTGQSRRRRGRNYGSCPPPPPPPAARSVQSNPPPVIMSHPSTSDPEVVVDLTKPPAYSTSSNGPQSETREATPERDAFPDEKKQEDSEDKTVQEEEIEKPTIIEDRLFKTKSTGLRFKIKSLFRGNASLAQEMKSVLVDTDSQLCAWVIRNHDLRQIPHSAFHSLEATHMRTIISQLNNDDWYQTFTRLEYSEHNALDRALNRYCLEPGEIPPPNGHNLAQLRPSPRGPACKSTKPECQIIVLKLIHEEKTPAWRALLREILRKHPFPPAQDKRIILAIVREKLIDGKPANESHCGGPRPPPPPMRPSGPVIPLIRPPPAIQQAPLRSRVSDLTYPFHPVDAGFRPGARPPLPRPNFLSPPIVNRGPPMGPPCPPSTTKLNPLPLVKSDSVRIFDSTPLTEHDTVVALTTFNAYTVRLTEPLSPGQARSWSRVSITQESTETSALMERIASFERAGGDIIETKLHLTEQQSAQVTHLVEDVKLGERDPRFEWTLVEMTLYNRDGQICDFVGEQSATTATHMHLIVKRMPKGSCKPMELYNNLMRAPPNMPYPRPMPAPVPFVPISTRRRCGSLSSSSSGSDSDSESVLSSGSSDNDFRMKLRRAKAKAYRKRVKEMKKRNKRVADSDDSDEEKEEFRSDVIEVKLDLQKGDDIVKALLELWTPLSNGK